MELPNRACGLMSATTGDASTRAAAKAMKRLRIMVGTTPVERVGRQDQYGTENHRDVQPPVLIISTTHPTVGCPPRSVRARRLNLEGFLMKARLFAAMLAIAATPFMARAADEENPYKKAKVGDFATYKMTT